MTKTIEPPRPRRPGHHLIKEWRTHLSMTASDVAARALDEAGKPMSSGMISQLEVGRAGYTQHSLERIARALHVEPWMLLAVHPDEQQKWLVAHADSRLWRELSDDQRECFWKVLSDIHSATFQSLKSHWPRVVCD